MSKSFSRRDFLRLVGLTAGGTALAGCGGIPATTAPSGAVETKPAEAPAAAEKITLKFWSHDNTAFIATNDTLIKKFKEGNPNLDVKYENFPFSDFITKIQTSMAAKNEADVMEMFGNWVIGYAKGNTLSVLPEDRVSYTKAQELFYKAPLDGYVWKGKLYGLPNEFNLEVGGVLINKRMFKEAGVTDPPAWKTWDELVADAKKMTKMDGDTMTVAGFHYVNDDGLGVLFWEGVLERGADYFAADKIHVDFLTPQAGETVQWLVDMANKDKIVDPKTFNMNSNWVGDSFFQGMVAIGHIGSWIVPESRTTHPDFADPWDYVSCPHYGDQMSYAADSGWGKVVSPNSKNAQAAWDFALYWTVDEANARAWNVGTGTIPALKTVATDATLLNDMNWIGPSLKVLPYGRFLGDLQDNDFIKHKCVALHINECIQGMRSVGDTMKLMNDEANKMIDSKLTA